MCVCPLLLLLPRVGWLNDEDTLDEEEDGGRVEELRTGQLKCKMIVSLHTYRMNREQHQIVGEHAAPYDRCEL